jgi:hypothetical protein
MIFGQRMTLTELALTTWIPTQPRLLRALASLADLWSVRAGRLSTSMVDNTQIVTVLAVGILIGLGAGTLLADQLMFAIGFIAQVWSVVWLQPPLQQGSKMQQGEQLLTQQAGEQGNQQQGDNLTSEQSLLRVMTSVPKITDDETTILLVEDALRHLHDRSYLGQHPLAQLQIVKAKQWAQSDVPCLKTHLSLGHALHSLLADVIEQLRPTGLLPGGALIPPREWHPYTILHASYIQGELTREIMARLYISEGTYNRTRRALQSITRALLELERQFESLTGCHD